MVKTLISFREHEHRPFHLPFFFLNVDRDLMPRESCDGSYSDVAKSKDSQQCQLSNR